PAPALQRLHRAPLRAARPARLTPRSGRSQGPAKRAGHTNVSPGRGPAVLASSPNDSGGFAMKHLALALTTAVLLGPGAALAADEPKELVEYREAVMTSLGGHAGSIARIVKQQVSYDH